MKAHGATLCRHNRLRLRLLWCLGNIERHEQLFKHVDARLFDRPEIFAEERRLEVAKPEQDGRVDQFVKAKGGEGGLAVVLTTADYANRIDRVEGRKCSYGPPPIFPLRKLIFHAYDLLSDVKAHCKTSALARPF